MSRQKPATVEATGLEIGPPELTCYPLWPDPPALIPARADRDWMDMTSERYAYRCIPLSIANSSGWEISLPFGFEAAWYGGDELNTIQFRSSDARIKHHVTSHFGHGVITFHTGWMFRTSPGWACWARGAPNMVKDGAVAALAADPNLRAKAGGAFFTADLAEEYGFTDVDGRQPHFWKSVMERLAPELARDGELSPWTRQHASGRYQRLHLSANHADETRALAARLGWKRLGAGLQPVNGL